MDPLIVTVSNPQLLQHFIACAQILNREQKEDHNLANQLNTRLNPWFRFGRAQLFLAVNGSQILGRVAGFSESRLLHPEHGYFGLLETVNDLQVAQQLLRQVETWLVDQGKPVVIGPVAFNSNYGMGLLVEGGQRPGQSNLPVNPHYYNTLLTDLGYSKEKDFSAYGWSSSQETPEKFGKVALRAKTKNSLAIRSLADYPLTRQIEILMSLYNQTMDQFWEFAPLSKMEARDILLTFRAQNLPDLLLLAEYQGQLAAFCLTLVEHGNNVREARIAVLGVVPKFRHRGIEAALLSDTIAMLKKIKVHSLELSYVAEDNLPVTRLLAAAGAVPSLRYRVYRKEIRPNA